MAARIPQPWLRKSTGTWHVQIDKKTHYLGKDKQKAWDKYHVLMTRRKSPESTHTARQVITDYLAWMGANRATETSKGREPLLKAFRDSLPKRLKAEDLRPHHVQKWIDKHKDRWNSTTCSDRITMMQAVWSWAKSMGYIDLDPLKGMPKPRRKIREDFLPKERWKELLDLATDDEFRDLLNFCLLTGARAQEVFKLKCEHYVEQQGKYRLVLPIKDSKGHRSSRVIWLSDEAQNIVDYNCLKYADTGHLFRRADGVPWDRNSVRLRFRRIKEKMDMPGLCLTTLRHSFAHYRLTEGQDAMTVAKLMGHTDTRMIATRYGHLLQNTEYMTSAANAH